MLKLLDHEPLLIAVLDKRDCFRAVWSGVVHDVPTTANQVAVVSEPADETAVAARSTAHPNTVARYAV